jgi:hypothetical protein
MTLFLRSSVFAFVLGAALAAAVLVGRSAFASTDTINACLKQSNGTLYILGGGSGRSECQPGDIPISWNTAGLNGRDGVSVTTQSLAPGADPACPDGGSKFVAANGVSYACNGSDGQDGQDGLNGLDGRDGADGQDGQNGLDGRDGVDGQDGQNFSGTFTSPNGQFKLVVDDTTAKLEGPGSKVQITVGSIQVQTPGLFSASGSVTAIGGTQILLNGSGCGILRATDVNPVIGPTGGAVLLNPGGSPAVRTAC